MTLILTSPAFDDKARIPDSYSCKGRNISPPLEWTQVPESTKSFVLIMEDLDTPVGVVTHWILYNIPSGVRAVSEDLPHEVTFADGTMQGRNSMRRIGYMGPGPPFGTHRYRFTLYAIDTLIPRNPKISKKQVLRAIEGHILDSSVLTGVFSKKT